jgi:hypothetical protein
VRAVFSLMEGVVHRMKQIALAYYKKRHVNFSASEIMILSDKSYELDRQGKIAEKRLKASLTGNIRLAFSMFGRVHHSTYDLRVDNAAWEAFLKSIEVRDRLMHPKEYVQLNVSDDEMSRLDRTYQWFSKSLIEVTRLGGGTRGESDEPRSLVPIRARQSSS